MCFFFFSWSRVAAMLPIWCLLFLFFKKKNIRTRCNTDHNEFKRDSQTALNNNAARIWGFLHRRNMKDSVAASRISVCQRETRQLRGIIPAPLLLCSVQDIFFCVSSVLYIFTHLVLCRSGGRHYIIRLPLRGRSLELLSISSRRTGSHYSLLCL